MTVGERIRQARKKNGISQEELGRYLGIGKSSISEWESGKRPIPMDMMDLISRALDVSVPILMGWATDTEKTITTLDLSPEAIALARKYDQITDPYDKRMIDSVVDISFERCASREELPPIPTTEWLNSRIVGPDPRKARDEDLTDRTHTG